MEYLDGGHGVVPAVLCWLLLLYPVLTLPVFLRLFVVLSAAVPEEDAVPERKSKRRKKRGKKAREKKQKRAEAAELPPPRRLAARPLPPREVLRATLDELGPPPVPSRDPAEPYREPCEPRFVAPASSPEAAASPEPVSLEARRLRAAARRVARSPELERWIRSVAEEYLERTGTE